MHATGHCCIPPGGKRSGYAFGKIKLPCIYIIRDLQNRAWLHPMRNTVRDNTLSFDKKYQKTKNKLYSSCHFKRGYQSKLVSYSCHICESQYHAEGHKSAVAETNKSRVFPGCSTDWLLPGSSDCMFERAC